VDPDLVFSWFPFLLLAFGVIFAVLGARTMIVGRRQREQWQRVPGRVVGSRLDDGQIRSQVAFRHADRDVVFWNRYSTTMASDPVGREVVVLVNPADPSDAVVAGGLAGSGAVGVGLLTFGVLAGVVGVGLVWLV
jgi:hypothetical protein